MIAPEPAHSPASELTIGQSVEGRDIRVRFAPESRAGERGGTLLIGGLHGDEFATVLFLEEFCRTHLEAGLVREPVAVLPVANPDGYSRASRYNAHGVDLNRNCDHHWSPLSVEPSGPAPWSEPEICALRDFVLHWQPRRIVSLHWALAEIDADGRQSRPLAHAMWNALGAAEQRIYRLRVSESDAEVVGPEAEYAPCPGSLGQWCGYQLGYADGTRPAMVTLELPYDPELPRPEVLPEDHVRTLHARWKGDAAGYLRAGQAAVHKMLAAACHFVPS